MVAFKSAGQQLLLKEVRRQLRVFGKVLDKECASPHLLTDISKSLGSFEETLKNHEDPAGNCEA